MCRASSLEDVDEHVADDPPLLLRIADAGQGRQKSLAGIDDVQVGVEVVAERRADRLRLVLPQQAVVDEDAGHLRADRLDQQRRRHRRIDAAGQAADDAVPADRLAQLRRPSGRRTPTSSTVRGSRRRRTRKLRRILPPSGVWLTSG